MSQDWYYQLMGGQFGPVSGDELKRLAKLETVTPDSLVKKGESGNWSRADKVKGLFPSPPPRSQVVTSTPSTGEEDLIAVIQAHGEARNDFPSLPPHAETIVAAEGVNTPSAFRQPSVPAAEANPGCLPIFLVVCGFFASLLCFGAGVYLIVIESVAGNTVVESIAHGLGVYCIGQALFVGPVLFSIAEMLDSRRKSNG